MGKLGTRRETASRRLRRPALLAMLPLLGSCTARPPSTDTGSTVLYASGADLQSINPLLTVHPLAKQVQNHVLFMTLASYDASLAPVPRLATWSWADDRRTLRFRLRRDVRWHDGMPTTAADVLWTLDRARDPSVAYPRAGDLAEVRAVHAADAFTVVVRFATPRPTFPDVFTDLAILPAHRFADVPSSAMREASFNRSPVGNGPFAFRSYRPNQRWVFERAAEFPADLGRPSFERLVVVVVDEPTTKLAGLTAGELAFAGIHPAHAAYVRDNPRLRVVDYPILLVYGLLYNLRRAPFDDERVRRALTMALDRERIIEGDLYGFASTAHGPVRPEHPWFEPPHAVPHDPAAADALLRAAGWMRGPDGVRRRDGERLAFELLTVGTGALGLEQMIQAQLRAVGVDVRIRQLELSTFLALAQGAERDFDALVTGIPGDLALGYVAALFDGDGPLAYPGLRDAALTARFTEVHAARTEPELEQAWRRVQRRLATLYPVTWLYHARGVQGVSNRVRDVVIDLRGELAGIAGWTVAP